MRWISAGLLIAAAGLLPACAAGAVAEESNDAWTNLFAGDKADLVRHWTWDKNRHGWQVKDGALCRVSGAGYIWTKKPYGDFVLELEFKTAGNSGVFFRSDPKNPVHGGFEVQVLDSAGKKNPGKHDAGALYDVIAPKVNPLTEQWNHLKIRCQGPHMACWMNGKQLWAVDISRWKEPRKNPDGSKNKFKQALGKLPRSGHVGLQDHGAAVCYRNIRIKELK